jgi:putative ATPase
VRQFVAVNETKVITPLAERLRPRNLSEVVGQSHLLGEGKPLRRVLEGGQLHSMILWGPPGSGKTTLAKLLAEHGGAEMMTLSAVTSGVQDIRKAVAHAREVRESGGQVLLFVDEVHRFNKAQQDAFLPHIESGVIVFVGATTENPAFELNNALLSRSRVYLLQPVTEDDIAILIRRALADRERGLGELSLEIDDEAVDCLAAAGAGDARRALGFLETAADLAVEGGVTVSGGIGITPDLIRRVVTDRTVQFDKRGDHFYDQISALHKSIRGSNPDAAAYWLERVLLGGCDPHYVLRRLVRVASEDVGNADPRALALTLDAWETFDRLGPPEGELAISQAVIYLAVCAKSNAVYRAQKQARRAAGENPNSPVPLHIRNAPTSLAKKMGHGAGYRYAHDEEGTFSPGQSYFPDDMGEPEFYQPGENGLEQRIAARLADLRRRHRQAGKA